MKHNTVTCEGIYWTATILHKCGHEREWLHLRASDNSGEGCTIGKARHIVRAEAGMLCPDCRIKRRAPGGGRKPLAANDPTVSREITMPESYWTYARLRGDGNASAGIRSALARCCDAHAALAMAEYDGTVTDAHRDAVREAESLHRNSR